MNFYKISIRTEKLVLKFFIPTVSLFICAGMNPCFVLTINTIRLELKRLLSRIETAFYGTERLKISSILSVGGKWTAFSANHFQAEHLDSVDSQTYFHKHAGTLLF